MLNGVCETAMMIKLWGITQLKSDHPCILRDKWGGRAARGLLLGMLLVCMVRISINSPPLASKEFQKHVGIFSAQSLGILSLLRCCKLPRFFIIPPVKMHVLTTALATEC